MLLEGMFASLTLYGKGISRLGFSFKNLSALNM